MLLRLTMQTHLDKRVVELWLLWIIPVVATIVSVAYWHKLPSYLGYLWAMPALFVFIVIGFAVNKLKLWSWRESILPRMQFLHRPFVYAAYTNLVFVTCGKLLQQPTTLISTLEATLCIGFVGMLTGFVHDLLCVEVGLYVIHIERFSARKHGTILALCRYGFYYFGTLGLLFGLMAKLGHYFLVESPTRSWLLVVFIILLCACAPFLIWLTRVKRR